MPKRGVNDIYEYYELETMVDIVKKAKPLPYVFEPRKRDRDKALLALLTCTGLRISEALSVEVEQFNFDTADFVEIRRVKIKKRRKETTFRNFPLPKVGQLAPLTQLVMNWYSQVKKGPLFDIGRQRAWQIINDMTGKWCHFFRCQRISYLVNKFRDGTVAAKLQGIKKSSTIDHYYKGDWKFLKEELKE